MSIVDKVLDIIENDLNIKISKKKKQIIYDKFYPDIKDKIIGLTELKIVFMRVLFQRKNMKK